jgi:transposase
MEKVACVVGVDWGEEKHAFAVRDSEGGEWDGEIDTKPESVHDWVRKVRDRHREGIVVVALEQSRGSLIYALMRYEFIELIPINPRAAKAYRDSLFLSGAKDDPVDAALIRDFAEKHRSKLRPWRADDARTRKLRLLVEARRTLVDQRTSITQALSAALKEYFPQILSWFTDPNGKLARAFLLRWATLEQAVRARPATLADLIGAHSRKKPAEIEEIIVQIRSAVALTTDPAIVEAMSQLAVSYVTILKAYDAPIAGYDDQIEQLWSDHPDCEIFNSFPGAGPVMAPRLSAAFGSDPTRFEHASEMQKLSGIAPVVERSGKQSWTHARWRCPKFLRQTFHEFAAASLPFSPWALAVYREQRDRGAGHHAAVRALAFRWIRILFRCWKDRVPYNEGNHLENLRRRNSPIMARLAA